MLDVTRKRLHWQDDIIGQWMTLLTYFSHQLILHHVDIGKRLHRQDNVIRQVDDIVGCRRGVQTL